MIHHAAYSFCEGYGIADTGLRDSPLKLSIVVSSDGVYIPPKPAMRLHRYQCYLLRFLNYYVGSTDNSRRGNTARTIKITYDNQQWVYIKEFYCKSSMIWPFEGRLGTILMDDIKCTHDMHKMLCSSCYTMTTEAGGSAL